ncbi:hypothetical protein [Humisphaera borealis]|uniref:Uncharacterized protein n=1 Tax=Humisphaera borealis TaxID=2807512 RepID=A0A7M2WT30_9BACT|nr:hypothetical protein [Humisphaera borealis]QOV87760.1 hypothetical protein IPV69_15880 [Humisphaera borealis]
MTRSIFDPTGPNTERSGNQFTGADANSRSHMPESAVDGVVNAPGDLDDDNISLEPDSPPVAADTDKDAR